MQEVLVTIIVPCFNQSVFLDVSLLSVLEQSYSEWECLIIDDGSTDDSAKTAKKWCDKDKRFSYFFQENSGLSSARNYGLMKASGDFIQFLDADDYIHSNKLKCSIVCLKEQGSNLVICNFRTFQVDKGNSSDPFCKIDKSLLNYRSILYDWDDIFNIPIHCALFSKTFLKEIRFQEKLKAKEDWIFWLEVFQKKYLKVSFLNEPLAYYRLHDRSMTKKVEFMASNYANAIDLLPDIISQNDCIEFYKKEIQKRNLKINQQENHIQNYKKTKVYRIADFINKILNR